MRQKLYVVMGDVVSSRNIEDRDGFQKVLEDACAEVNSRYRSHVFTDFKIWKGLDEIEGVLSDISKAYGILTLLSDRLYPQALRVAIIYDYVDTAVETGDVTRMDGPAFHRGADCIEDLRERNLLFGFFSGDEVVDPALAGEINLLMMIKGEWSPRQRQVFREYSQLHNQKKVAEKLGITQQSVSKILGRLRWRELMDIEERLNSCLERYNRRLAAGAAGQGAVNDRSSDIS